MDLTLPKHNPRSTIKRRQHNMRRDNFNPYLGEQAAQELKDTVGFGEVGSMRVKCD